MMKFFRKYTKTLLAVFMALLLVVWLGGEALQSLFDRSGEYGEVVVGEAYGEPVRMQDLARVSNQEEIGKGLIGIVWNRPWESILGRMVNDPQLFQWLRTQGRDGLNTEEWYLLDLEAARNGVHISQQEINEVRSSLPADMLNSFREQRKVSIQQIDAALEAYLRIEEAALRAANAVSVSEPDIRDFVRDVSEKVEADMVVIDPQKLMDPNYQPTAEQMQAQFDKYKDVPAGPDEFGYQLPDITQVEYIEISVDELAKTQPVSEDEAYKYWLNHKAEFRKPTTQPVTTAPAEAPKPYETFTEAKPLVRERIQREKAVQAANRIAGELIRQLSRPWANQPTTQPGNFKQPPESEMAGDVYEKLIASYQDKYPGVLSYGRTPLGSVNEVGTHPKLGISRIFGGTSQPVMFREAAFMVAGLKGGEDRNPGSDRLVRNVYETSLEPTAIPSENVFVFRNVAARPAQAPATLDEVREQVAQDLRLIHAREQAEQIAKEIAEQAKASDLKTAFKAKAASDPRLEGALMEPEPFTRKAVVGGRGGMPQIYGGFIPGVGFDPQLTDQVFELADRATATQPTPVTTHKDNRDRWIVIEFQRTLPVTREEYEQQRELARRYLLTQQRIAFILDWFSSKSIHARADWKATDEPAAPEQPEGEPVAQKAAS